MITEVFGDFFLISLSQNNPSLPVFTPAEKFMSSSTMSISSMLGNEEIWFGLKSVWTLLYSNCSKISKALNTLLLSSMTKILASTIGFLSMIQSYKLEPYPPAMCKIFGRFLYNFFTPNFKKVLLNKIILLIFRYLNIWHKNGLYFWHRIKL